MIEFLVLIFLTFLIFYIYFVLMKDTIYGINLSKRNYNGLLLFREYILIITIGTWVVYILGVNKIPVFFVKPESIFFSSFLILLTFNIFLISTLFISGVLFKGYNANLKFDISYRNVNGILTLFSLNLFLVIVIIHLLGGKHAFISSLFMGQDLMNVRMMNRHGSNIPNFLSSYFKFLYIITSCILAVNLFNKKFKKKYKFLIFILIVYASTLLGAKAPLISCLTILGVGYISFSKEGINIGKILKFGLPLLITICIFMFYSTQKQFPSLSNDQVVEYIFMRIFTGQMMGAYEQLDLKLQSIEYIWRSIPFANILIDYKEYSKDLMMLTWGSYKEADEIGIMNSYFIGEAYAIGGFVLLIFSPILVAINVSFSLFILLMVFHKIFGFDKVLAFRVVGLSISFLFPLTGDIAGLLAFKYLVMYLIFLIPILFVFIYSKILKGNL